MAQDAEIARKWPLHWMVWNNDIVALTGVLKEARNHEKELKDPRGRTPLHLAVTLGHTKCAQLLVEHGANCLAENRHQWSCVAEAICCGQPELLATILSLHEHQLIQERSRTVPQLLETLHTSPDFYIEMKWEFTSWVPFLSRMCPSDTYKIWKKGSNVRVDTTLLGFHNMRWQRGHQSFMFSTDMSSAHMYIIDYDRNIVYQDKLSLVETPPQSSLEKQMRLEADLASRLTSPVISTIFNAKQLAFQRQKSGIWGFRSDRNDEVNGWQAKVFSATGVEIITRTRTEHLPEGDKKKQKHVSPFEDFLGKAEQHGNNKPTMPLPSPPPNLQKTRLTAKEYFKAPSNPDEYDAIGRHVDVTEKKQQLKATMWLAEGYPLSLSDQLLPIVELMALNNTHFDKLKDFLTLQVPAGFPVKIEIPLFHIMTAKVTFGNINGVDSPATHVTLHDTPRDQVIPMYSTASSSSAAEGLKQRRQGSSLSSEPPESSVDSTVCINHKQQEQYNKECHIADDCFKVPSDFRRVQNNMIGQNEEEELLQLAIQQSLLMQQDNTGEGLEQFQPPPTESNSSSQQHQQLDYTTHDQFDDDLAIAIALSLGDQETATSNSESSQQPQQQDQQHSAPLSSQMADLSEDEILEQILKLSLTEK